VAHGRIHVHRGGPAAGSLVERRHGGGHSHGGGHFHCDGDRNRQRGFLGNSEYHPDDHQPGSGALFWQERSGVGLRAAQARLYCGERRLNLLDHLWTTNLNASNTTFLGGLTNWYQTGLTLDYAGTVDPNGCILTSLTVKPAVTIETVSLPNGTAGVAYSAPITVSWVSQYSVTVSALPAGLKFDGANVTGTPFAAGSFTVTVTAIDSVGASASKSLPLAVAINPGGFTIPDEGQGKITAIGAGYGYLMVGTKKLFWNASTSIMVNTPNGERHVIERS
jgi:hypothetical protein